MRTFVPVLDAAEGRFDNIVRANELPKPIEMKDARDLHHWMQSHLVEIFDWSKAGNTEDGYRASDIMAPRTSLAAFAAAREQRSKDWKIQVVARCEISKRNDVLFGFDPIPQMTVAQLHRYIYLMLHREVRGDRWQIHQCGGNAVLDWRSQEIVKHGKYVISELGRYSGSAVYTIVGRFNPSFPATGLLVPKEPIRPLSKDAVPTSHAANGSPRMIQSAQSGVGARSSPIIHEQICERDKNRCQLTSVNLSSSQCSLGTPRVAHLLPPSHPWLIDERRFLLDPSQFLTVEPTEWRGMAANHPTNLMLIAAQVGNWYANHDVAVDPFEGAKPVILSVAAQGPEPSARDPRCKFPLPSRGNEADFSAPNPALLVLHLATTLAWSCRLPMISEQERRVPRWLNEAIADDAVDSREASGAVTLLGSPVAPKPKSESINAWLAGIAAANEKLKTVVAAASPRLTACSPAPMRQQSANHPSLLKAG